ncbi:hypothetical protein CJF31_00003694 [Rutstroemia sp. NJR-2017a BVV2]|nr:hypothetical protein CJF31_00003694 [Rutstroemia sp. NJR-2017a BVV2]
MRCRIWASVAILRTPYSRASANHVPSPFRLYSTNDSWEPLRILFCGSDEFSSASLRALHAEHLRDPQSIASIDVVHRPAKRVDRGLKTIRQGNRAPFPNVLPISGVAQELNLPVHERDTFTGWEPPKPNGSSINLIVAVSFGLFIPPRILGSAKYGGLNVHPSLLPQFRGAAPLQHTILQGNKYTGVTLQTLDPHAFDHGDIISQVPIRIPRPDKVTYQELLELVTPEAAKLLTDGIRDRLFLDPPKTDQPRTGPAPIHAHKILPEHRYIDPRRGMTMYINRQYRALGRPWSYLWTGSEKKRVIFNHIEFYHFGEKSQTRARLSADLNTIPFLPSKAPNGPELWYTPYFEDKGSIVIRTNERHKGLRFKDIIVEGQESKKAADVLSSIGYKRGELRCIVWALPEREPEKPQEI